MLAWQEMSSKDVKGGVPGATGDDVFDYPRGGTRNTDAIGFHP